MDNAILRPIDGKVVKVFFFFSKFLFEHFLSMQRNNFSDDLI